MQRPFRVKKVRGGEAAEEVYRYSPQVLHWPIYRRTFFFSYFHGHIRYLPTSSLACSIMMCGIHKRGQRVMDTNEQDGTDVTPIRDWWFGIIRRMNEWLYFVLVYSEKL